MESYHEFLFVGFDCREVELRGGEWSLACSRGRMYWWQAPSNTENVRAAMSSPEGNQGVVEHQGFTPSTSLSRRMSFRHERIFSLFNSHTDEDTSGEEEARRACRCST